MTKVELGKWAEKANMVLNDNCTEWGLSLDVSIPQAVISWLQLYHAGSRVALEMM